MPLRSFNPALHRRMALNATTVATVALDATNDGVGAVLQVPKAGTIDRVGIYASAVIGAPPTYRVGVEGLTTTRQPNGVYLASGSAYVDVPSVSWSPGWFWFTLGTPVSVAAGDRIAATARYQTGTVNASNCVTAGYGFSSTHPAAYARPFALQLVAGTWSAVRVAPFVSVRYTDGTVVGFPISAAATTESWSNASSPLHLGCVFTPPVRCRLSGAALVIRPSASSDFEVRAYVGGASSPARSAAVDADVDWASATTTDPGEVEFDPLILEPNVPVRVVVTPTTANAITQLQRINVPDADSAAAWMGDLVSTRSPSVLAWTDDVTRLYPVYPVIDQVDAQPGAYL